MKPRQWLLVGLIVEAMYSLDSASQARAEEDTSAKASPPAPGASVPDFSLKDVHRRPRSLAGFKDKNAYVIVFLDTECL